MQTLDDVIRTTVSGLMASGELFTALDVSNKVKETMPFARHREVRDFVRGMFTTDIEPSGWARTPISVTLADGSQAEALLYHPLSDAWDLDNKYDQQKRSQAAAKPAKTTSVVPATVAADGTVSVTPAVTLPVPLPVVAPSVPAVVAQAHARDVWENLFKSQPSLFPRRP